MWRVSLSLSLSLSVYVCVCVRAIEGGGLAKKEGDGVVFEGVLGFSGSKTFWSGVTQGMFVKQSMHYRILIDYITNCTSTNVQTAYCTETLNQLKTLSSLKKLNHLKLKILENTTLEIVDQLEFEVSATIVGEFWLQNEYHWTRSLKNFYFNLLIDDVLFLWVCHLAFFLSQTYKKHLIYIKISTYGCDLFNY